MNADDRFAVRSFWSRRPQSRGEFVDMVNPFIARLKKLHPIYRRPMLLLDDLVDGHVEPLAEDLSNIESFVARYGWYKDSGRPTCVSPNGVMSREGTTNSTFDCSLLPGRDDASAQRDDHFVKIKGGSQDPRVAGHVWLEFPNDADLAFESTAFAKQLLLATVECFDPGIGTIDNKRARGVVRDLFPEIRDPIVPCWLNYFRDAGVRRDLPSWVHCEDFGPHGGVLISLQPDRPRSTDDPAWIERVKRLHEALKPGNWYANK